MGKSTFSYKSPGKQFFVAPLATIIDSNSFGNAYLRWFVDFLGKSIEAFLRYITSSKSIPSLFYKTSIVWSHSCKAVSKTKGVKLEITACK